MSNNIIENEALTTQKNNDNSYIILEDILYYSSPKRGIKSKSNIENKNYTFTPFSSNTEMYNTHFTLHIKESSTDIGSKEELINSQKNSNIISDFSLLKNSKLDNTNTNTITNTNTKEKEKENYIKTNIKEEIEKEEECEEEKIIKYKKSQNLLNKNSQKSNNNYSLNFEEDTEEQNKNHKKFKRKNRRYCSMDINERTKMKKKKDTNSKRYVSIDIIDKIKKEKKGLKIFRSGDRTTPNRKNIINERKILKEIKDKLKNENEIKNKNTKNNKVHRTKNISSFRYPLSSMEDNNLNDSNNYKSKTCKKGKRSNNHLNNDDIDNFEDKNFISHPIKYNNNKDELYKNIFNNKSSRFIKKKQFSLIKEIDRDYDEKVKREIQSAKKINKLKNSKKKNKKSKKHFTEKPKKYDRIIDDKNTKEVSDFVDLKESKNHRSKKTIKNKCSSPNIFRKGNMKNKEKNNDYNNYNLFKSKKNTQIILLNNNQRLKLKSSITLNKKEKKKSTENNTAEKPNKKELLRRHTIFITSEKKQNFLTKKNDNSSFSSENNSIIEASDNGYDQDCSSNSSSVDQNNKKPDKIINSKMEIGQITEDKLVLNYQDKKETIEVLSDKENIDNYYEYLELCLETLQDMNINEVPKSKAKINFNFPKENQNKKIALFDLDETLVHCIGEINKNNCNKIEYKDSHKIKVILPCKKEVTIGINVRPHWKESLDKIKEKYNIVIFTASHQSYSDAVLNYLDPEDIYFHYRLYRDSCALYKTSDINFYVKDLDIFKDNYNLKDIIIIDNSILSFAYHINNGIPVVPFYDSKQDSELPLLCFYLLLIASYKDLRDANKEHIKLEYFLAQNKTDISSIDNETMLKEICEKDKESNNKNSLDNEKNSEKPKDIKFSNEENKDSENKDDNNNKEKDDCIGNKSEKRLFNIQANNILQEKKKYNTVKIDSLKIVDFFDKWKNAYLKLALKK